MASGSKHEPTFAQQRASDAMDRAAGELVTKVRLALAANRDSAKGIVTMINQAVGLAKAAMITE